MAAAVKGGQPVAETPQPTPKQIDAAAQEVPAARLLVSLLQVTVFTDLFCHVAHRRHVHPQLEARVAALAADHRHYFSACRWADLVSRLVILTVVVVLGAAFAGGVIYRAFYLEQVPPPAGTR